MFDKNKSKIILFNGPKGSGKDESCNFLKSKYSNLHSFNLNEHLAEKTKELFLLDSYESELFDKAYADRELKEKPIDCLRTANNDLLLDLKKSSVSERFFYQWKKEFEDALSPREAMIFTSEVFYKPNFGDDCWVKSLVEKISKEDVSPSVSCYVCNSVGFNHEMMAITKEFNPENILLIEIRGRGDFGGDSRNFISSPVKELLNINSASIYNNQDLDHLFKQVDCYVEPFLLGDKYVLQN